MKTPQLKQLYDELQARKRKLTEELAPHREYHDKHVNDPRFLEARQEIKRINAELIPIDNELAGLARALGAKGIKAEPGEYQ